MRSSLSPLAAFLICLLLSPGGRAEEEPLFRVLDRIAAVVGGEIILESDLNRFMAARILPQEENETPAAYRDRVLEVLIIEILKDKELRSTGGLEPSAGLARERLKEIALAAEKSEGIPFAEILKRAGVTEAKALAWIARGLALDSYLRDRLLPKIRITPEDVQKFYDGPFREEAAARGLTTLPPLSAVEEEVKTLIRERRLNEEITLWIQAVREKTRIVIYRR